MSNPNIKFLLAWLGGVFLIIAAKWTLEELSLYFLMLIYYDLLQVLQAKEKSDG